MPSDAQLSTICEYFGDCRSLQAQQQQQRSSLAAAVQLRFELQGLDPVQLPVKLRPGPPVSMDLQPGHPFREQARFDVPTYPPPDPSTMLMSPYIALPCLSVVTLEPASRSSSGRLHPAGTAQAPRCSGILLGLTCYGHQADYQSLVCTCFLLASALL